MNRPPFYSIAPRRLVFTILGLGLLLGLGAPAAALDAAQQAELDRINATLRSAEADLQAARSSAGTAQRPAQGSRLRLTTMRLESGVQKLNQAAGWLSGLPANDEAVAQARARHAAAVDLVNQINAILNPQAQPEPEPEPEPAPGTDGQPDPPMREGGDPAPDAPAPPPLHYTQKDQLGNARFNLRDSQGYANHAASIVAQIDDPDTAIVHSQVLGALQSLVRADEKLGHAKTTLAELPADHPDVAAVVQDATTLGDQIGATRERLTAAETELGKLAKIENYPEFDHDFNLLRELAGRYANFQGTAQRPELMAQVIREDATVLEEIQRIAQTYLPLVEQRTAQGEQIERMFNHFQSKRGEFAGQLDAHIESVKTGFDEDLAEIDRLADEGVEKGRPAYFGPTSGIEQRYGFAEDKLIVLQAMGDEVAGPYAAKLEASRAQTAARAAAFREQIIQGNTLPPDNYAGDDRDAIVACAIDAWGHQQENAQVLAARIPREAWVRTTKWEWFDGTFYKVDVSRVQVQLLIKYDDRLAVNRPINIKMDHLAGDRLTGHPLWDFEDEVSPLSLMLLENVE